MKKELNNKNRINKRALAKNLGLLLVLCVVIVLALLLVFFMSFSPIFQSKLAEAVDLTNILGSILKLLEYPAIKFVVIATIMSIIIPIIIRFIMKIFFKTNKCEYDKENHSEDKCFETEQGEKVEDNKQNKTADKLEENQDKHGNSENIESTSKKMLEDYRKFANDMVNSENFNPEDAAAKNDFFQKCIQYCYKIERGEANENK